MYHLVIVIRAVFVVFSHAGRVDDSFDATGRFSFSRSSANYSNDGVRDARYDDGQNGTFWNGAVGILE